MDIPFAETNYGSTESNQQPQAQPQAAPEQSAEQPMYNPNSWWDRARANASDAFRTGTLAGQAMLQAGKVTTLAPSVEEEQQRRAAFAAMPSWTEGKTWDERLKNFSAMVAGQVVGSLATPETFVAAPVKGALWAARGADALTRFGRRAAVSGATQAGVNAATDPIIQGSEMNLGLREEYDPTQTAVAAAAGGAIGGVAGAAGVRRDVQDVRNFESNRRAQSRAIGRETTELENEAIEQLSRFTKPDEFEKYAGNINLDRISAGEDVYQVIADTAKRHEVEINAAKRGTITNEELRVIADDLDLTPEQLIDLQQKHGLKPEEMLLLRSFNVRAAENVVEAARRYNASGAPEDLLALEEARNASLNLMKATSGATESAGQLLQQQNIVVRGEEKLRLMQQILEKNPQLAQNAQEYSRMISSLEDPRQRRRMMQEASPASPLEKIVEAWKAGLLTSARTHMVNVASNAITTMLSIPEEVVAAGVGKVRQATIGGGDAVTMRGALSRANAMFSSTNENFGAWANFLEAMRTGETPKVFAGRNPDFETNAIGGTAGEVIRTPFRLLTAEDAFFKSIAGRMELSSIAYDTLSKRAEWNTMSLADQNRLVQEFIADPPPAALSKALEAADYLTFNKELGALGQAVQNAAISHPSLQFIIPFVRTPINIIKYGIERTPLGALGMGNLKGKELDRAIARATVGSSIMAAMYALADEGVITGSGTAQGTDMPSVTPTGFQPYSIRIGDKFYPYERFQPLGMLMGIAADMNYMAKTLPEDARQRMIESPTGEYTPADLYAGYAIKMFMENIVNNSFTQGINNLFKALNDEQGPSAQRFINSLVSSAVPAIVGDVARAMDPVVRGPSPAASSSEQVLQALQSRIPGMTKNVPARRDWTGQDRTRDPGAIAQMLSPVQWSEVEHDKTINEVARLRHTFQKPSTVLDGRKMTPEQYQRYEQLVGNARYNLLAEFVNSASYDDIANRPGGDTLVKEQFQRLGQSANTMAKAQFIQLYPEFAGSTARQTIRALEAEPRRPLRALENR